VDASKVRRGQTDKREINVFSSDSSDSGVTFELVKPGGVDPIPLSVTSPATITSRTASEVTWASTLSGGGADVSITGT
jgi:hypothetical protein